MSKTSANWRWVFVFFSVLAYGISFGSGARAQELCWPLPPIDPTASFVENFDTSCYVLPLVAIDTEEEGRVRDLTSAYETIGYTVTPGYDIVLLGEYPNARYLSVMIGDAHTAVTAKVLDKDIPTLVDSMTNPFVPGQSYQPAQRYGMVISFGEPVTTAPNPGCSTADTRIEGTVLDVTNIHEGFSWNGTPLADTVLHKEGPVNIGGMIVVRRYLDRTPGESASLNKIIVRDLSTGCAISARQAIAQRIVMAAHDTEQIWVHWIYNDVQFPLLCYRRDFRSDISFLRPQPFVSLPNTDATYLSARVLSEQLQEIQEQGKFVQIQFKLPVTPPTPCEGTCSHSGDEELRYLSLSFKGPNHTIVTISDADLILDSAAGRNATLVVNVVEGQERPPAVTAENGFTYVDLTQQPNWEGTFQSVTIRSVLPHPAFSCSAANVPPATVAYHPFNGGFFSGGFMGPYLPTTRFLKAEELTSQPPIRAPSCSGPPVQPQVCPTF